MFSVFPRDQERYAQQGKTTLYYVGLDYDKAHKGAPPPLRIKNMIIPMPKLGEHIILDDVYAKDVIFRTMHKGKAAFVRAEDGGEQVAEYIRQAQASGQSLDPAKIEEMKMKKVIQEIPDDVLIEALRQRQDNLPEELLQMLKQDKKSNKKAETKVEAVEEVEEEVMEDVASRLRPKPKGK